MVFSSVSFLFYFLPVVLLLYYVVPQKGKNLVLLLSSLVFYFVGVQELILAMLACILLNYAAALLIGHFREKKRLCQSFLALAIVLSLGFLFVFKYADFVIENVNRVLHTGFDTLALVLPIGISFYTFQTLSYTVDVYRGSVKPVKNPLTLAAYVAMFPQLVAGPIVRYRDIEGALVARKTTLTMAAEGIRRFVIGLSKKVILANTLAELCRDIREGDEKTVLLYWLWAVAYLFVIYFDFSGYSDMAIGLGKLFGFEFTENFNYPYISKSVTEFFRRWHISLSSFFRDYVYIPLGGNRKGRARQLFNLLIVWTLTGLWHGASWNFVVWGLFYAFLLILEKLFLGRVLEKLPSLFGHLYTLLAALFGFVIFDADSLTEALSKLGGMFGAGGIALSSSSSLYALSNYAVLLIIAAVASLPIGKKVWKWLSEKEKWRIFLAIAEPIVLAIMFLISTAFLVDSSYNPFIYFRF